MSDAPVSADLEATLSRAGIVAVSLPPSVRAEHLRYVHTWLRAREACYEANDLQRQARMLVWKSRVARGVV